MENYAWTQHFHRCFDKAVAAYVRGDKTSGAGLDPADLAFLRSVGCSAQELFDFVDDLQRYQEPSYGDALLIASVRRDFFLVVQKGKPSGKVVTRDELPEKTAAVDGIEWLPRIISKARAKLRGELSPDTMFGCGGDRAFLKKYNLHPADFLRTVWAARDDDRKIIEHVKDTASR
ncbi:MAG: DUF5069 domain-containing protein [Verrucomicrobiae bacterium]|nr:DUF5069 domain-containing protein [Verrucomicrobiae bacterium]